MAGWFTHLLVAQRVLEKLPPSKRSFLSGFAQLDDYLFGSIAPDARYIPNVNANITHKPFGKESAFEAFDSKSPFVAGYETHLITDKNWDAIVNLFKIDATNDSQKLALYFAVDRYLQLKSGWFLSLMFSGNVIRADNFKEICSLGISKDDISKFKSLVSSYLPAADAASFISFMGRFPVLSEIFSRFNQEAIVNILDSAVIPKRELNGFLTKSVSDSAKALAKNI